MAALKRLSFSGQAAFSMVNRTSRSLLGNRSVKLRALARSGK